MQLGLGNSLVNRSVPPGGGSPAPAVPVNTSPPTLGSTNPVVGEELAVASLGEWTNSPDSYSYQWQRDTGSWVGISGASSDHYTPGADDYGAPLRCLVTAYNSEGASTPEPTDTTVAVVYVRTAFVDHTSGNNSTALLDDPNHPFDSVDAAINLLNTGYNGQPTTLQLLSDLSDVLTLSTELRNCLDAGLTIRSHGTTRRTLAALPLGDVQSGSLTLVNVEVSAVTTTPHVGDSTEVVLPITGDTNSVIGLLTLSADQTAGGGGNTGASAGTVIGDPDNPPQPGPASPPTPGTNGGSASADGNSGGVGGGGNRAWSISVHGPFTITQVTGIGGPGGTGGTGGNGGTATGGQGGQGGDSSAVALEDGAQGGRGGDASANAGGGGVGGEGGVGSVVTRVGGATNIIGFTFTGGSGGFGGFGGFQGSATAGGGGGGGAPAIGGAIGAGGASGTASNMDYHLTQAAQGNNGPDGFIANT